jgi:hypothetical protein
MYSSEERIMIKSEILKGLLIFLVSVVLINDSSAQINVNTELKISDNGHYFLDKKGKPFFWQGDTEWELFRYLTADDARALLIERKKQAFFQNGEQSPE